MTVALADVHREMASFYSHTGRPSIDPELLMRMLIVGYCYDRGRYRDHAVPVDDDGARSPPRAIRAPLCFAYARNHALAHTLRKVGCTAKNRIKRFGEA